MKRSIRIRWVLGVVLGVIGIPLVGMVGLMVWMASLDRPFLFRSIDEVKPCQDVRWRDLGGLDLRGATGLVETLGFNRHTRWPRPDRLPPGVDPGAILTNAMNPGLGVRELHRQGITGQGVHVAIFDYFLFPDHPEYAGKIAGFLDLSQAGSKPGMDSGDGWMERALRAWVGPFASMHGPAVASLLVGEHCGTAPGAKLHYVATPDPGGDSTWYARGLDWVLERNRRLPREGRIRVVSVSAAPSGKTVSAVRHANLWDEACRRAEAEDVLVIDGTSHHGFVGPCNLDPRAPEDPSRCTPMIARGHPEFFAGRLFAPVGPRTTAEEYRQGRFGYQYTGIEPETFFSHGSSWSMPYVAGVAALGWQVNPALSAAKVRQLLFETARVLPGGEKVIDPRAFVERARKEPAG